MLNIFITGSENNVGKTFITAGLAATMQSLGYSTCVYKPVETGVVKKSGFVQSTDLILVKTVDPYIKTHSTYMLKEEFTPVISAETERMTIDKNVIKKEFELLAKEHDCIVIEGSQGIMTPLAPYTLESDLIKFLNVPAAIIINPKETSLNQALLTINHAEQKGIEVRGVIINNLYGEMDAIDLRNTPRLIEEYSNAKILGIVRNIDNEKKIEPNSLITDILNGIDIESLFNVKIDKLEFE